MTIYDRIRYLREKQGISQQDLADILGYKSRSTINKIELGLRDISQSKVIAFANALHTTPAYLMGWEENKNNKPTENDRLNEFIKLCSHLSDDELDIVETLIESLLNKHNKED